MADDAADTVASVLAQAFTIYEKSIADAKAAFKKTLVDDRKTSFVVFPLDVMVAKQEVHVILPPLPSEEHALSPPASPPADPVVIPPPWHEDPVVETATQPPSHEDPVVETATQPPSDEHHDRARKAKARAMALWELNYRTQPCENPDFVACGQCAYGRKCRFFHRVNQCRRPPTDAEIDELAKYYLTLLMKN